MLRCRVVRPAGQRDRSAPTCAPSGCLLLPGFVTVESVVPDFDSAGADYAAGRHRELASGTRVAVALGEAADRLADGLRPETLVELGGDVRDAMT